MKTLRIRQDGNENHVETTDGELVAIFPVPTGPDISWNEGRRIAKERAETMIRNQHQVAIMRPALREIEDHHNENEGWREIARAAVAACALTSERLA